LINNAVGALFNMTYPADFEQKLGFDLVRQKIKNYCLSSLGLHLVDQIAFSNERMSITMLLKQNLEFRQILEKAEVFPTANYFDPQDVWPIVAVENTFLEEDVFQHIILSLQTIFEAVNFLDKQQEAYTALFALAQPVVLNRKLLQQLQSKFDDAGKVKDSASAELARVRRRLREEEGRVRKLVDQIFRQAADQGYTPEGMSPTLREGRLVIPLLAEYKRRVRGFIIDESATGQTVFLEPAEVLETNNEIRDLLLSERREVIKILQELTTALRLHLPDLRTAYRFLAQMDFTRAKAKFSLDIDAEMPLLTDGPCLFWNNARHPLLALSLRGKRPVVPLNINLSKTDRFLLVSGPNAGGKSVVLKTTGLLQYMLQCGLLVPMDERSEVGVFEQILLDIGDQQSIENDLSTYSSHLRNMKYFVEHANDKTLVLMDELGSGTDPNFGGGIAQAVLANIVRKGVWGVATTHYYNLKLFASNEAGIRNGAMMFDIGKLEPQFILDIGKPGSSFALEIARKTGLPAAVVADAENTIGKDLTGLEALIKSVADEKQKINRKATELQERERKLTEELNRYHQLNSSLEARKKEIIDKAKAEASSLLKETNREIEKTIRHIKENKAERKETRKVRDNLKEWVDKVQSVNKDAEPLAERAIGEGDKVRIRGQEVTGTVLALKGSVAEVQFGNLRSTVKAAQLIRSDQVEGDPAMKKVRSMGLDIHQRQSTFSTQLDIRGKRVEETFPLVDQFLDDAVLLGHHELRILHGKGEGVLRKVVREHLKKIKSVLSVTDEHVERGGDGITIVVLK
jgi:DNA mismatch repair protein MutS2